MVPTEILADLAQSRGVTVRPVKGTAMLEILLEGVVIAKCTNITEAIGFVRGLHTVAERAHFLSINSARGGK